MTQAEKSQNAARAYHHGNLKAALLDEAEAMLERDGLPALTLRAIARAVGVTHAAPANHFGDITGLLSELAAIGFNRFTAALVAAMDAVGSDADARMKAMGQAYVGFARKHPGLFVLMFRSERLDDARPALREALDAPRAALRTAVAARAAVAPETPLHAAGQAAAMWSLVHGFAMLLIDKRFDGLIAATPGANADTLLEVMLDATSVG